MKIVAGLFVILALVIGILPQFTDCQSQGRELTLNNGRNIPMKCHWTARAELALAAPLLVTGVVMAGSRRKEALRNTSVLGVTLGALVIALPTALIGVCGSADMVCNSTMRPAMIFAGSLAIVAGLVGIVMAQTRKDEIL